MTVLLDVVPLDDDQATSFADLKLFHRGCTGGTMAIRRDLAAEIYHLSCKCGLQIDVPVEGPAVRDFDFTAIDEMPRELAVGSFSCNRGRTVQLSPRNEPSQETPSK